MDNQPANSSTHAQKLSAKIAETWNKLTPAELAFQTTNPDKFNEAVKAKYSIDKDEIAKTVKKLDAECAATCTKDKAAAPTAKAS